MRNYRGGSVHTNGCYEDVKAAVQKGGGHFYEFSKASREITDIQRCIQYAKDKEVEILIGAGGASVMDAAKIISFGFYNDEYWELIKKDTPLSDQKHLPIILIPTYPSSGSEYDDSAVATDKGYYGLSWGLTAETAILVPKYSLSLNKEMTLYSCLVTLVQLCVAVLGDKNHVSYDLGISVIKNVIMATRKLIDDPNDLNARATILYAASISTSSWLGLGKSDNYSFQIYYVEIMAELLFDQTYRKALTVVFPWVLKVFAKDHADDVKNLLNDAFGFNGNIDESVDNVIQLFADFGIEMKFTEEFSEEKLAKIQNRSSLSKEDIEICG